MRACREAVLQASPSEELAHIQAMLIYGCVHIIVKGLISGSQDVRVLYFELGKDHVQDGDGLLFLGRP